ncbi:hypothetical protein GLYMA_17G155450v4 [Glycine max]|nr:hypothetical protein GLYMA_17G155450v4 [Glycine max]KAH1118602.1 hypothetical protein GYH30_047393 [Glycine max]
MMILLSALVVRVWADHLFHTRKDLFFNPRKVTLVNTTRKVL